MTYFVIGPTAIVCDRYLRNLIMELKPKTFKITAVSCHIEQDIYRTVTSVEQLYGMHDYSVILLPHYHEAAFLQDPANMSELKYFCATAKEIRYVN